MNFKFNFEKLKDHFLYGLQIFFIGCHFSLFSSPDLTIVGFFEPEGGIGKVPITIIETVGDQISTNIIETSAGSKNHKISSRVKKVIKNPDESPGRVALLTDVLGHFNNFPSKKIPKESIVKLAYSMLESTQIPNLWVNILNEEFDAVVVPDKFLVSVYENSGVKIPIFVLPMPMNLKPYFKHQVHSKYPSKPFIFADCSANKNPAVLIEAFAKAFGNSPNVQLLMRAGHIFDQPRELMNQMINRFELTNVKIEQGHLLIDQYIERLFSIDAYVNLSRGEGYSLIPREALALGIPVIISNNTASKTICDSGFVRAVKSDKRGPANPGYMILFHEECGEQFDCEVNDVVEALRDVYENYEKYINKARLGRKWVNQYNCQNAILKRKYCTLFKPKKVILGEKNKIKGDTIITNSPELYLKYSQIVMKNK